MKHKPTQDQINRDQALENRNDQEDAFYSGKEKQAQRDQLVMPIDDISNELVEEREEDEQDKRRTKGRDDV